MELKSPTQHNFNKIVQGVKINLIHLTPFLIVWACYCNNVLVSVFLLMLMTLIEKNREQSEFQPQSCSKASSHRNISDMHETREQVFFRHLLPFHQSILAIFLGYFRFIFSLLFRLTFLEKRCLKYP